MGAVIGRYVTGIVVEKLWETGQGCFDCGHRLAAVPPLNMTEWLAAYDLLPLVPVMQRPAAYDLLPLVPVMLSAGGPSAGRASEVEASLPPRRSIHGYHSRAKSTQC